MALRWAPLQRQDSMLSDDELPPEVLLPSRTMIIMLRIGPPPAPPSWRPTLDPVAIATSACLPTAPTLLREPRITVSLTGLAVCLTA